MLKPEAPEQVVLKQMRHVHLYSGTPGRTVWAQSRQTNRPSLWAINPWPFHGVLE